MVFCCMLLFTVTGRAEDNREGYQECIDVRHEMKHFNEELVDKNYVSYSMSGSAVREHSLLLISAPFKKMIIYPLYRLRIY